MYCPTPNTSHSHTSFSLFPTTDSLPSPLWKVFCAVEQRQQKERHRINVKERKGMGKGKGYQQPDFGLSSGVENLGIT